MTDKKVDKQLIIANGDRELLHIKVDGMIYIQPDASVEDLHAVIIQLIQIVGLSRGLLPPGSTN